MKSWIKTGLVILVPSLVVVGVAVTLQREGFFKITKVEVTGEDSPGPLWLNPHFDELAKGLQKFRGQDMWNVELRDVNAEIRDFPWVREARVSRAWPDGLRVSVQHKEIIVYARGKKGALRPVLEDGTVLQEDFLKEALDLPLLAEDFPLPLPENKKSFEVNRQRLMAVLDLLHAIPDKDASLTRDRISELGYDTKEGYWMVIAPFGTRVRWGSEDLELKISRVNQVLSYLDSRQIGARVIDADLSKKVVVRLRKTP